MKRAPWDEIAGEPASRYLLVGILEDSFVGGPHDEFDSDRLRFAVNLMKRCCTGLMLQGTVAVQASRRERHPQVQISTDDASDFQRLGRITGSSSVPAAPWKAQSQFSLDEAKHQQLLEFAGAPDKRGAGRRERERRAGEAEDRSLRWKVSERHRQG